MRTVPKVSVSIITYNHEKYIAKAIDSVLAQQTDFDFEMIIGDDCSTDGTIKILEAYGAKHPNIIQLILHPKRYDLSYAVFASNAAKITEDGDTGGHYGDENAKLQIDNTFTNEDVLRAGWCLMQTSSLMYRNKMFREFPNWFWNMISADFGLILLFSQYGKIKYLKKSLTAYRIHNDSFMAKYYFSKKMLALRVA